MTKGYVRAKDDMLACIQRQRATVSPDKSSFALEEFNDDQLATIARFVGSFYDKTVGDEYRLPEREAAFAAIDGERSYQERRWPNHAHTPTEFLVYIVDYAQEALHVTSRNSDTVAGDKVLHNIRKVAALAVSCMEQNGTLTRGQEQGDLRDAVRARGFGGAQGIRPGPLNTREQGPRTTKPAESVTDWLRRNGHTIIEDRARMQQPKEPAGGWYMGHPWGGRGE